MTQPFILTRNYCLKDLTQHSCRKKKKIVIDITVPANQGIKKTRNENVDRYQELIKQNKYIRFLKDLSYP